MPHLSKKGSALLVAIGTYLLVGCGAMSADADEVTEKDVGAADVELPPDVSYDALTAEQILTLVATAHRNYKTMTTKGFVTMQRGEQEPKHLGGLAWAYRRPNRFHFNYEGKRGIHDVRCLVFFDETEIRFFTAEGGAALFVPWDSEFEDPIGSTLAGIQSCTNLLPYVLHLLLREDALSEHLFEFEVIERLPDANKQEVRCLLIRGKLTNVFDRSVTLWVSAETFAIERIVEHLNEDDEAVVITTELVPVVNEEVCDSYDFPWNPPEGVMEKRYEARDASREGE